jgi:hypothetical protein
VKPLPDLPDLRILPTDKLRPHESVDVSRITNLTSAIAEDGVLRNPPIVTALTGSSGAFLVLDGANRTHALQELNIPFTVAQVVNPASDDIRVQTWNHAVIGSSIEDLIAQATAGSRISAELLERPMESAALRDQALLAAISDSAGRQWQLRCAESTLTEHLRCLDHLVNTYSEAARIERTNAVSAAALMELYPAISYVVVFPAFRVSDVVEVATEGRLFPSGLTRFVVSPRALRVNYPLSLLSDTADLEILRSRLRDWIDEMLSRRSVRYYAESTFVFDE